MYRTDLQEEASKSKDSRSKEKSPSVISSSHGLFSKICHPEVTCNTHFDRCASLNFLLKLADKRLPCALSYHTPTDEIFLTVYTC